MTNMKFSSLLLLLVGLLVLVCHAEDGPVIPDQKPNSGFVSDANVARGIAKAVVISLLPQSRGDGSYDAALKDGIWTVRFLRLQLTQPELTPPVVIQIRQKTGAIIKYEDPRA